MEKNERTGPLKKIVYAVLAACLGGWTLAVLNVLAEMIKGGSIFGVEDIYSLSLWHIMPASVLGTFFGVFYIILRRFRKSGRLFSPAGFFIPAVYISVWFFVLGYVNIYFISGFFSGASLFWNGLLAAGGTVVFLGILRFNSRRRSAKTPVGIKVFAAGLLVVTVLSLAADLDFFSSGGSTGTFLSHKNRGDPYNVLFIVLDAVRRDHLGCYGYERETSPHIDRLAENGVIFDGAFANSSHTIESVASYISSVYPSSHNVRTLTTALPEDLVTLPQIFRSFGYHTAVFSVNPYVTPVFGYGRGVDDFFWLEGNIIKVNRTVLGYTLRNAARLSFLSVPVNPFLNLSRELFAAEKTFSSGDAGTVTGAVKKWIDDNEAEPFFAYIHYHGGHAPYHPPAPFDTMFDPDYQGDPVQRFPEGLGMFLPFVRGKPVDPRKKINMTAQYDGQIRFHDEELGGLFGFLQERGLDKKTVIVITSDHGEEFFEHRGWGHGQSLYDELIRVPLIAACPGMIPAGRRIGGLVELVDIFPTLIRLCGMEDGFDVSYKIEGRDLTSFLLGEKGDKIREHVFCEVNHGGHFGRTLRSRDHKAVFLKYGNRVLRQFFDIKEDPRESKNLLEKQKEQAAGMFSLLDAVFQKAVEKSFKEQSVSVEDKQKDQLKSLGYIKD